MASAATDRITGLTIKGLRTLAEVSLTLDGVTALIGANGSGKTSIAEACVLLKRLPSESFMQQFHEAHGGLAATLRRGASALELGIEIEGARGGGGTLRYEIQLIREAGRVEVGLERILGERTGGRWKELLVRERGKMKLYFGNTVPLLVPDTTPIIGQLGLNAPSAAARVVDALSRIEVHRPFRTTPEWEAKTLGENAPLRQARVLQPEDRLTTVGANLVGVWHALKNEKSSQHWDTTMEYVRLGLGQEVDSVNVRLDPGGAQGALSLLWRGQESAEPAYSLSDGMLSYLCFVAMFRLEAPASLLVFDEPETHLHPDLLQRVVGFFESIATRSNVLLCTHSDRLLDALADPVKSAVLMDLDSERATRLLRTTEASLKPWLEKYRGLGRVRAAGLESEVFDSEEGGQ